MIRKILFAATMLVLVLPVLGAAQGKPVNVALFNPIQIFPEDQSITGIRINFIYGKNVSMQGLDWGLVNGVGTGGFLGVQLGAVNYCQGDVKGFQYSFVNYDEKNVQGFQWGWFNRGDYVNGLQLGFINMAQTMKGLQIGLINFIHSGGQFPVFPIVNWSF